jgi:hypothetical protein
VRRRQPLFLILLTTVALLPVTPADAAAAPYGRVRTIRACTGDTHAAANASGVIWATTSCGTESYTTPDILRPGSSWSRRSDRFAGRSLAVADDGRFTYSVMTYHGTDLNLHKMQHDAHWYGGAGLSREAADYQPTVVGRDGRYWAVWAEHACANTSCPGRLFQQRSLGAAPARTALLADPSGSEDSPSMALRGDGVVLAFVRGDAQHRRWLRVATAGLDGTWVEHDVSLGYDFVTSPSIAVSGGRTILGYVAEGRPWVSIDDGNLNFGPPRAVPYRARVDALRVAASGGRAFVATSTCFPYAGATTCRVYVAEGGLTGPLATTEVSVGSGAIRWQLEDLVAARGRATVLMDTGSQLVSRSQNG